MATKDNFHEALAHVQLIFLVTDTAYTHACLDLHVKLIANSSSSVGIE